MPIVNFPYLDKYNEPDSEPLGSGTFSTVHRAIAVKDGKEYAAKKVKQDAKFAEKTFEKEIEILQKIKPHQFIVNMIECFPKAPCVIVLDLVSGGELFDEIVKRVKYNENDSKKAVRQLLTAIKFLHEQGIAHCDLKPENILLDKNGDIKVTDYGLAQFFDASNPRGKTTFGLYCGTPEYMAKEMHKYPKRKIKYDETVDEYAVGVISYIMLVGYPPWQKKFDYRTGKIYWDDGDWEELDPSVPGLIKGLMDKNQKKRLSAEQALTHKWLIDNSPDDFVDRPEAFQRLSAYNARRKFKIGLVLITMCLEYKNKFNL